MPNIAIALKQEIGRLARKELRSETEPLKKAVAAYRKEIAALKRRMETLERQQKRLAKPVPSRQSVETDGDVHLRFRADGFAQHRKRLGLSAREMGLLLDASPLSVYKWEAGKAKPRAKHLAAIAAVRKLGRKDAAKRLEALAA
ncbi:MAG: helix-turn-helix domain-containing protein [Hyphomicrobiales bacterium]|nr:MAG: helix-turn-helix domain-containing protein [Hyphomicrobiales bacterium]